MLVVRAESMTTTTVSRSTRSRTASSFSSGGFDTGTDYGLGTGDGPITTRAIHPHPNRSIKSLHKWRCLPALHAGESPSEL
ncbi:hypothetical protein SUGI_1455490 [Cryptomeria japonica]|uniref:Uncharacterized protein n=1 Tax=Cryptomeria japonica TaxID=3369 RepID=A0AAD3RP99_CRYJA|nr:hypothetical protein SUGI_1424760 [Cryptomeria japonica]GLJ58522.1 hypothetical protein SUGI_1455490 [Cryptomeria japonica]